MNSCNLQPRIVSDGIPLFVPPVCVWPDAEATNSKARTRKIDDRRPVDEACEDAMGTTWRPVLECNRWPGHCVRVGMLLCVLCAWAPAVNPAQGPTSSLQQVSRGCRGPARPASTTGRWPACTEWSAPLQSHGRSIGLRGGDSEEGSASDDQLVSVSFILCQRRFEMGVYGWPCASPCGHCASPALARCVRVRKACGS